MDDVTEAIEGIEDYVQSVTVASMNKISWILSSIPLRLVEKLFKVLINYLVLKF